LSKSFATIAGDLCPPSLREQHLPWLYSPLDTAFPRRQRPLDADLDATFAFVSRVLGRYALGIRNQQLAGLSVFRFVRCIRD
jgi:hypothetical protein